MRKYKPKCQGGEKTLTLTRNVAFHCLWASEKCFWGNLVTNWLKYTSRVGNFSCCLHLFLCDVIIENTVLMLKSLKDPFQWHIGAVFCVLVYREEQAGRQTEVTSSCLSHRVWREKLNLWSNEYVMISGSCWRWVIIIFFFFIQERDNIISKL